MLQRNATANGFKSLTNLIYFRIKTQNGNETYEEKLVGYRKPRFGYWLSQGNFESFPPLPSCCFQILSDFKLMGRLGKINKITVLFWQSVATIRQNVIAIIAGVLLAHLSQWTCKKRRRQYGLRSEFAWKRDFILERTCIDVKLTKDEYKMILHRSSFSF